MKELLLDRIMDLSGAEVYERDVDNDNLESRVTRYVDGLSKFLASRINGGWDEKRIGLETQFLLNFFEAYNCFKQGDEVEFPKFKPSRWNAKLKEEVSSKSKIVEFLRTRAIPDKDSNNTRIRTLGSQLTFRDPTATLVSVGGGKETIDDTPFHKNVVLLDPLYINDENLSARINGYREIPLPYSLDVLKSLGPKSLGIELNFSLHHIPGSKEALAEILSLGNVRGVIVSDYDISMSTLGLPFILENIASLFPLAAECYELRELGITKFITMHTNGLLETYLDLAQKQGFKIQELDFYPKLDPILDDTDGLTESEKKYLERGTKFAVTFLKQS